MILQHHIHAVAMIAHLLKIRNDIMETFALNHHQVEPEYYL